MPASPLKLFLLLFALLIASSAAAEELWVQRFKVKSATGSTVAELKRGDALFKVEYADDGTTHVLKGKSNGPDDRKYKLDGTTLFRAKAHDDGFVLKSADGRLLWKVKFYPDRIKISDNAANRDPWQIRARSPDHLEVQKSGQTIGSVKFYRNRNRIKVKSEGGQMVYKIDHAPYSGTFGLLLIDGIPAPARYALMAEILRRGR